MWYPPFKAGKKSICGRYEWVWWCGWKTCFGARQPGPKMTATAPFTTCAHWCQTETEMRIETKICKICGICKHPLSAWAGGWVADIFFTIWLNPYIGVRHWINQQVFGSVFDELNLYVKFDQGTWLILTPPILNAGYAWDWGQPILDNDQMQICAKDFSIHREKEGGGNDLRKFHVDKILTKKSLSLQVDSAGGGQREFHWVLFSWTQRAVFNISRNTVFKSKSFI